MMRGLRGKCLIAFISCSLLVSCNSFKPIHDAALKGDINKVKYLVSEGSDVNAKDENELTPLHYAAKQGATLK